MIGNFAISLVGRPAEVGSCNPALRKRSPRRRGLVECGKFGESCIRIGAHKANPGLAKKRFIRMMLHSIFLSDDKRDVALALPEKIHSNIESFIRCNGNLRHNIFTTESLREFIKSKFDLDVLNAYDDLIPLAYKADLGRYCVLYESGGAYSDLSIYYFDGFFDPNNIDRIHVFRDASSGAPWIVSNSIIAAPPKAAVFSSCIKKIVQHTRERYYGENALCPTGPHLFGAELASTTRLKEIACGETIRLPQKDGVHNFAYVSKFNEFMAINYKRGHGISSLGAKVNQSYASAYNRREIYNSSSLRKKIATPRNRNPKKVRLFTGQILRMPLSLV